MPNLCKTRTITAAPSSSSSGVCAAEIDIRNR